MITHASIPPAAAKRSVKVQFICGLMRGLQWETGETGPILAKAWGTSKDVLKQLAAEAHRRVKDEVTDPEVVGRSVASALLTVIRRELDGGDLANVIKAAKVWSDITGASAAIQIRVKQPTVEELSDEELLRQSEEAIRVMRERKVAS